MNSFTAKTHTYTIGGVQVPSVSQVIAPLSDYSNVNPELLVRASEFGSNVHVMIKLWLDETLDEDALDPNLVPLLEAFRDWYFNGQFADVLKTKKVICEIPIYHQPLMYAGTPDIVIDGVAIIDIKTRKVDKTRDSLQLVAYKELHLQHGGIKANYKLIVLRL